MKTDAKFYIMTYQYYEVEKKEVVKKSTDIYFREKDRLWEGEKKSR